nr:hypothetical protein 17 [Alphaproteobacteria bacterium]
MITISSIVLSFMFFVITDLVEAPLWVLYFFVFEINDGMFFQSTDGMFSDSLSMLDMVLTTVFGFFSGLVVGKGYSSVLSKFYDDQLVIWIPGVFICVLCVVIVHMYFRGAGSVGHSWLVETANLTARESYELAISCFSSWIAFSWAINPFITKSFLEWMVGGSKK